MKKIPEEVKYKINQAKFVFVGTSSQKGVPHLLVEKGIELVDDSHISFTGRFCKEGVKNLGERPKIAIGVIDDEGEGYQLLGDIVEMKEKRPTDDAAGSVTGDDDLPTVEHHLNIRIDKVMAFGTRTHSDRDILP